MYAQEKSSVYRFGGVLDFRHPVGSWNISSRAKWGDYLPYVPRDDKYFITGVFISFKYYSMHFDLKIHNLEYSHCGGKYRGKSRKK